MVGDCIVLVADSTMVPHSPPNSAEELDSAVLPVQGVPASYSTDLALQAEARCTLRPAMVGNASREVAAGSFALGRWWRRRCAVDRLLAMSGRWQRCRDGNICASTAADRLGPRVKCDDLTDIFARMVRIVILISGVST